jgi:hypothetical protein
VKQNDENDDVWITPNTYLLKTWCNPVGKREIVWSCGQTENQVFNLENTVSINLYFNQKIYLILYKKFFIGFLIFLKNYFKQIAAKFNSYEEKVFNLISFLDGLQKVLIFADEHSAINYEVLIKTKRNTFFFN